MDKEEEHAVHAGEGGLAFEVYFFRGLEGLLLCSNFDHATLALGPCVIDEVALQSLLPGSHNLVEGKLHTTTKVVAA